MVSITRDGRVAGYYCLSSTSLIRSEAPVVLASRQPDPIPVILLGRLAVDVDFAGQGLGSSLLQHAIVRAVEAAETIGVRAILVHAISDELISFYSRFGFESFPGQERTLFLLTSDARTTILDL